MGSLISSEVQQFGPLQRGTLTAGGGERCVNSIGESAYWNRRSWKEEVWQCGQLKRICEWMCLEAELTATEEASVISGIVNTVDMVTDAVVCICTGCDQPILC